MYCFYDEHDPVVPFRIVGATHPEGQTDNHGSIGELPSVYVDESVYPDVKENMHIYKIDSVTKEPVQMIPEEQQAILDSIIPPEPTTEERLMKSEDEGNKLRQKVVATEDMLNGLVDYLSVQSVI